MHQRRANIETTLWHKDYSEIPKPKLPSKKKQKSNSEKSEDDTGTRQKKNPGKPTFFVYIAKDGEISRIERVEKYEDTKGLRKWKTSNGYSFPYLNIPPVWWIYFDPKKQDRSFEQALDNVKLTSEQLNTFIQEKTATAKQWEEKHLKRIDDCLGNIAIQLKSILGDPPCEYRAVVDLIEQVAQISADKFYNDLQTAFKKAMLDNPVQARLYFEGAFYHGEKEPGNLISILLEVTETSYPYPVRHTKVRNWINSRLLAPQSGGVYSPDKPDSEFCDLAMPMSDPESADRTCSPLDAFGNTLAGSEGKLPDVNVGTLGLVKLRAMNDAARCQYRYGKINEGSFPVGKKSRDRAKTTLEWLTADERENRTWATVSRAVDNKEILLAYPSELPPEPPDTAMFFGGSAEIDSDNTAQFENCAQNVTGALRGLMAKTPKLDIRVFLLRKMDIARTRVASHKQCSAQHFIQAAEQWHAGCRNLPHVLVKQFTKGKDEKTIWREPEIPFPMEIVWALNALWMRGGEKSNRDKRPTWSPRRTKNLSAEDGIALLIDDNIFIRPVIDRMLYAATRNLRGLALALGQAHAQGQVFTTQKNYARQALIMPSAIGLLLYKLNITKEHYMKSPPYLVGRLLSLADQLHYHYCQNVRDGSVPPQLMGNALMATALEQPVKALALYCNRILPYQAWAGTVSGEAAGLARYFLSELGKVSSELGDVCSEEPSLSIPEQCTDTDKAQMLIGYLARPEKSNSETLQQGD